ncbi:MAG TPA: sigma-70 family RNA polymerase sigma factor, partial [Vicinamibacterales bacterium]|nr:sigma-70 family RNA polymerase sigma factor [Vicinamibacterales bacterium]
MTVDDFEAVYRRFVREVFRYAASLVTRRDIAEEITSEAFLELYRAFDRIDTAQLPAWLFTVVRNRAVDYWRHAAVEQRYLAALAPPPLVDPPEPGGWESLLRDAGLGPQHRVCLLLRYAYGMTRREIARETGLTAMQVKGLLQYARELVRRRLAGEDERGNRDRTSTERG